ncbi:MAG: Transcriptional regulator, CopG family [Archaeoglobus fulgidus]|uniref:Transcriptional regulator, CopG family n=1 Tax=Archaeoglobus fulgidus TaxID=2234 RepID=A0A101DEG6_ARCFL|nr:ribbon-helix-helix domain-containing protein [Archaeoglobus fulgidus]KUJ94013.1 MAG: Transcriptional regulator, CopG family [Archaeoglobus fulgidus]KUK07043.1 MAG: Transcriptional regulator, CopG family [Archaeoglobus fulgidus]
MVEQVHIGVRIPKNLAEAIDRIAKQENNPRSAVIRRLLSEAIKIEIGGD